MTVDQLRFIAGAARCLDGKAVGEYAFTAALTRRESQEEIFDPVITMQSFAPRPRRWRGRTARGTAWRPRCERVTTAAPCAWPETSAWAACGSTRTSGSYHGGYRHSANGKDLSMYDLEGFTRVKHVMSYIEV
ncbi:hypothetical protein ACFY4C_22330 [Actinomadura viridis]|uniref:hypothetical protein n=1 Tax=Actinomadura viridis TaxID=58110 RepID=UPI00367A276B